MLIKCLPVGHLMTNCYIVTDETTLECAVIDPGDESNTILYYLEDNHLTCRAILLTHGHYDHTGAVYAVHEETGAPVYMNALDAGTAIAFDSYTFTPPEGTIFYKEGDEVKVGNLTFRVMETPGHTPGGVTLICGDALFTGDTLFAGSCGRTDFEGGSMEVELQSLAKIAALPGDYEVYPGHMDCSTLETERRFNPYLTFFAGFGEKCPRPLAICGRAWYIVLARKTSVRYTRAIFIKTKVREHHEHRTSGLWRCRQGRLRYARRPGRYPHGVGAVPARSRRADSPNHLRDAGHSQ